MAVGSLIAIGTSKGLILIFDQQQNLKATIGIGSKAVESGSVTSVALSADFLTVAGGHGNGNIFTWEIARPVKPFLQLLSVDVDKLQTTRTDGHVSDVPIYHLGFLGTRHTALVSADERGMAFSHLASRGLGVIARGVKTTRILGRYPETKVKPRKPSSVLAFAPLPLGTHETATDNMGLVAMLTPFLLVVVSTTPVAQTQHKASRPTELAAHGAMTGSIAWYPAMEFKNTHSNAKIAYCWQNVVTILAVQEIRPEEGEKERPVDLQFLFEKRWQATESIVGMQWLNKSVLAILTISQQLVILEDDRLTMTDTLDLLKKHIYRVDLFSEHLSALVENLDDESMHGVVADAFYMSFKAYKGRLFLLGFNDISIGTLSNWADRLLALMEQGDFIGAIELATSYYDGGADKAAIGLPLDRLGRHNLVRDKLIEMMSASLRYAFGKNAGTDTTRVSESQLEHLVRACFAACLLLGDMDFLFGEVYPWYSENASQTLFLRTLEASISDGDIKTIPPVVLQDLVNNFVDRGYSARLEEIICLLDPSTLDLDRVNLLCKRYKLHDALFYVWSQALADYVTILKYLLDEDSEQTLSKIFPFLSYTLTGRMYPTGDWLPEETALTAKADVYYFLFFGSGAGGQDRFHYLRTLLNLETSSFMSMLNEAFEDSFLDESSDITTNLTEEQRFGVSLTRQYIMRILLDIMIPPEYEPEDIIYLDMFIARNQPKYSQFVRLPGNILQRVLLELCDYPSEEIADDCQLSVEYLMSVFQPPDLSALLPVLLRARFYRVVKTIYRSEKQYDKLLETCFLDRENPNAIFESIDVCFSLSPGSQLGNIRQVIAANAETLLYADLSKAALAMEKHAADLHGMMVKTLEQDEHSQYVYLKAIFSEQPKRKYKGYLELYIRLMCEFDPYRVTEFIERLDTADLRLEEILPAVEDSGAIDAAIILMAREGHVRKAMDRVIQHLQYLEAALVSLVTTVEAPDAANTKDNADDLVQSVEKYSKVGLWVCQNQTRAHGISAANKVPKRSSRVDLSPGDLLPHETPWVDLLEMDVNILRDVGELIKSKTDLNFVSNQLRTIVQDIFTALLVATSIQTSREATYANLAFLRILRAFLDRVSESSPSLVHLRSVLGVIFSAYAYEENLLSLANHLLDKDLFVSVEEVSQRRKRGWRPSGQICSSCGMRLWGPGVGAAVWDAWHSKHIDESGKDDIKCLSKGKQKIHSEDPQSSLRDMGLLKAGREALILFPCHHSYHKKCLDQAREEQGADEQVSRPAYRCLLEIETTTHV